MEELKMQLLDLCNKSQLPVEALYFVIKDLYRDAEDLLRQMKMQEKMQQERRILEEDDDPLPEIEEEIEEDEEE